MTAVETVEVMASSDTIEAVWLEFKTTGTEGLRNQLVEHYWPLVKSIARRIHVRLSVEVEFDDLVSAGTFGLMDAISGFDPTRGIKFEIYCPPRIRGAIIDELRETDWVPRLVRLRSKSVAQARQAIEVELGRRATTEEIAHRLNSSLDEFIKIYPDSITAQTNSLYAELYETDSGESFRNIDLTEDLKAADPLVEAEKRQFCELILKQLDLLSHAAKLMVELYFFEDLTMKAIAELFDYSESRVSQIFKEAFTKVRAQGAFEDVAKYGLGLKPSLQIKAHGCPKHNRHGNLAKPSATSPVAESPQKPLARLRTRVPLGIITQKSGGAMEVSIAPPPGSSAVSDVIELAHRISRNHQMERGFA